MFIVITGGCGSGKSWMAEEVKKKIEDENDVVILDCVASLLSDGMKDQEEESTIDPQAVIEDFLSYVLKLRQQTKHLIVVTNEVFSDVPKSGRDGKFVMCLGQINQQLARESDHFVEMVYGIPIWRKEA